MTPASNTRSEKQIIKENVFTFFNLIFIVLAAALLIVGSFKNMTFLLVAIANTVIGIFQETRAKRAVDKLTLVTTGSLFVMRDGQRIKLRTDQLVRDDIVEFAAGDQICADAVVRAGQLQVNESLLTGEADAIIKNPGATFFEIRQLRDLRQRARPAHARRRGELRGKAGAGGAPRRALDEVRHDGLPDQAHHRRRHYPDPGRRHALPAAVSQSRV